MVKLLNPVPFQPHMVENIHRNRFQYLCNRCGKLLGNFAVIMDCEEAPGTSYIFHSSCTPDSVSPRGRKMKEAINLLKTISNT